MKKYEHAVEPSLNDVNDDDFLDLFIDLAEMCHAKSQLQVTRKTPRKEIVNQQKAKELLGDMSPDSQRFQWRGK